MVTYFTDAYIDELVQERCSSMTNALELRLSCTNPSIYVVQTRCVESAVLTHSCLSWLSWGKNMIQPNQWFNESVGGVRRWCGWGGDACFYLISMTYLFTNQVQIEIQNQKLHSTQYFTIKLAAFHVGKSQSKLKKQNNIKTCKSIIMLYNDTDFNKCRWNCIILCSMNVNGFIKAICTLPCTSWHLGILVWIDMVSTQFPWQLPTWTSRIALILCHMSWKYWYSIVNIKKTWIYLILASETALHLTTLSNLLHYE